MGIAFGKWIFRKFVNNMILLLNSKAFIIQMTQQLTSPSNCSINENALRFNSSSGCLVSPSESNFNSSLKNNLVQFEQYNLILDETEKKAIVPSLGVAKKKLTIKIDESFDGLNSQQQNPEPNLLSQSVINCSEMVSHVENKNDVNYYQLLEQFNLLKRQCEMKDNIIASLRKLNQEDKQNLTDMRVRMEELQESINLKNVCILEQNANIQRISTELTAKHEEISQMRQDFERKKKQLRTINQGLTQRNKILVKEAKISDKKIKDLQKQSQINFCLTTQENLQRLKQSSVKSKQKQNLNRYNGTYSHSHHQKQERDSLQANRQKEMSFGGFSNVSIGNAGRKSLERKKNTQSSTIGVGFLLASKKKKIGSSSSNTILTKKLMQK